MESTNLLRETHFKPPLIIAFIWLVSVTLISTFYDKEESSKLTAEQQEDRYLMYGDPYIYFKVLENREQLKLEDEDSKIVRSIK